MMVDKAVSTNDNNFNEFSRAYKYDAVISTLIENKILSIKKECKENSTSKRKRRKSSRKISFSRKFFVSCRSKRSSIGSGISNNNDVSITKQEASLSIPVIDNDGTVDTHKTTDIHLYDFDDGTVSATIDNLSKTTVSQVLSKTSSSAIVADVTVESIGGYSGGGGVGVGVAGNVVVQPKILRSISTSHDDTDFNISSQNEQSTSKLLLLKDISTVSSNAFQHHHHQKYHHRNEPSLSSSTSSSVASASGRFDENIHIRVIDKKRIKNGDGDDGSGGIIGDISSNESIDISSAIIGPTSSSSNKENDKDIHHVKHTKKSLIPDGLVASIKHSFHSLALYNQYNNKTAADVENNFLYEAKSISAPTSPTMLFSQNIIKSQTMMISSENVKSQVSYIRKSIRCPNYNSNKITINNTNNTNINNSNNINKNNKKTFKNSLSEIFSRQNTSEDSANVTISTLLNEDDIVNSTIGTTTEITTKTTTTAAATNNNSNNLIKNKTFHSSNSHLNNNNKIMDSNSTVIELNDELSSSNQFVENRLDSTDVVSAATATTTTTINKKSQNLNDSSLCIKQNESSNQSKLNSETVIINNKHSDIISAIVTTAATNTLTDNTELKNDKSKILSTSTATTKDLKTISKITTTTDSEIIGKLKKSDELFQNLFINQNLSNVSSILPSSMTGSNLMSINSSYTSQTTKTQSTATAATKSFDRNALLASRIINGRYLHSGSDDEYRRNKRKYKRYHRCSDPVLVYPSTSGLQHCILSMPPNQIHQINCNEDFVYDLTYQADQNINDDKESIVPEPVKKSRHHKHKKKHRHRQKPKILVHDLDTQCVKVIDPDDLPQRARWTIIATACLLLLMCLMLVGITLRMAPIIDDIVRQENERLMQESINRAMLAKNYTESNF